MADASLQPVLERPMQMPAPRPADPTPRLCPEGGLRANWFNPLRLVLAGLVLFSHCYPIARGTNDTEPLHRWTGGQLTWGTVAVDGFFLISGFLIVRSWLQAPSLAAYFQHRVLRIYPGFLVAMLVSLGFAALSSEAPVAYLRALDGWKVLGGGLTLSHGFLDNARAVFTGNPLAGAVNEPTWTIRIEFAAYLGVAVGGLGGLLRWRRLGLIAVALVLAVHSVETFRDGDPHPWLHFGCCFALGGVCFLWRDALPRRRWLVGLAIVLLGVGAWRHPWLKALLPVAGGWLLFHVAFLPAPAAVTRLFRTDLSYGVYLYAFPVQQSLVHFFGIRQPLVLLAAALPLTLLCAWLSWTLIERRCLALKSWGPGERVPPVAPEMVPGPFR